MKKNYKNIMAYSYILFFFNLLYTMNMRLYFVDYYILRNDYANLIASSSSSSSPPL